jgi:hypothetical protein
MSFAMRTPWTSGIAPVAMVAALGFSMLSTAKPAEGGVFVGFGFGFPVGFPAFYYPPYLYPYYPPVAYYSAPSCYPSTEGNQPSSSYAPQEGYTPSASAGMPPITYTPRRGWINAQGQYCREYKSTQGPSSRATERYGTACRDASGQWRIVN